VIHDGLLRYKALVAFEAAKELGSSSGRRATTGGVGELKASVESYQKAKQGEIDALARESGRRRRAHAAGDAQACEEERFPPHGCRCSSSPCRRA